MKIRKINKQDFSQVDQLIRKAFDNTEHGYGNEAELVDKIRQSDEYDPNLELVAIINDKVVGHGLLSDVYLDTEESREIGLVLAPVAVDINHQNNGIGKQLIASLEEIAIMKGYDFISVLGWPTYYSNLGYKRASLFNIYPPFEGVPDEAFLIKELKINGLEGKNGIIHYSSAFE
ncbi:GNAT family N-acetyltransferase [Staphylococcus argenteus]|uniref:GNAT family N-acetyltransferase n=1 Tax=Staphylococcus argenteus TaxID=985002 RepID=UPI000501450C|nr:N-acetyltransferase [Staphylococcus argenteus]API78826.1 acetyltransferase [Staphylococcus argenteus]MBE2123402.1 N-acetyltransferase [Staphylococcus argenteus]MBE2140991.1 N-acetyltransferase [Staphylococcus argenteus]MCG6476912.1 N-acetyltransferase [Staphylococcus argenteus]MCG9806640.1 N-acetyltransferase [Staphylococcus argenteus]